MRPRARFRGEARGLRWGAHHEPHPPPLRSGHIPPPRRRSCSSGPGAEPSAPAPRPSTGSTIVSRGMEWGERRAPLLPGSSRRRGRRLVVLGLGGFEPPLRSESNSAWNAYRSDCSGFVTWAWGFLRWGTGGYVHVRVRRRTTTRSSPHDLRQRSAARDALNKTPDEHIILFKQWVSVGHVRRLMEEPGCSAAAGPTRTSSRRTCRVQRLRGVRRLRGRDVLRISLQPARHRRRRERKQQQQRGWRRDSRRAGRVRQGWRLLHGDPAVRLRPLDSVRQDDAAACTTSRTSRSLQRRGGYCTETLQCDGGHWVPRQDDPSAGTSVPEPTENEGWTRRSRMPDDACRIGTIGMQLPLEAISDWSSA